jgi:hypothetical protein
MTERTEVGGPLAEPLLDVEVAVLDEHGAIVAVNDSWNAFTLYNGGDPQTCGVGANYLDVCARAGGEPNAVAAAELIDAAIHGHSLAATSILIDCHAPSEPRWFELFVSPRADPARRGATVMLLPTPVAAFRAAGPSVAARFPDVYAVHQGLTRRLAALQRLLHAISGAPTDAQIDEALRHVDAAIVALQRTSHEIDAQRP